jgi:hypothetical protein
LNGNRRGVNWGLHPEDRTLGPTAHLFIECAREVAKPLEEKMKDAMFTAGLQAPIENSDQPARDQSVAR